MKQRHSYAILILGALLGGCASTPGPAPRSSLSRETTFALAEQASHRVGGRTFDIAATGSMRPFFDANSFITVEPCGWGDLNAGDVVIYRRRTDGSNIVHRLLERVGSKWLVCGDANGQIDNEAVTTDNLVGRVCAIFYASR